MLCVPCVPRVLSVLCACSRPALIEYIETKHRCLQTRRFNLSLPARMSFESAGNEREGGGLCGGGGGDALFLFA